MKCCNCARKNNLNRKEKYIQRQFLCGKPSIIKFDNCRTEQQWLNMDRTRCRKRLLKKKIRMTKKYLYKLLHETKLFTRYQKHKCFWACSFGGRSDSARAEKFNIILKVSIFCNIVRRNFGPAASTKLQPGLKFSM